MVLLGQGWKRLPGVVLFMTKNRMKQEMVRHIRSLRLRDTVKSTCTQSVGGFPGSFHRKSMTEQAKEIQ